MSREGIMGALAAMDQYDPDADFAPPRDTFAQRFPKENWTYTPPPDANEVAAARLARPYTKANLARMSEDHPVAGFAEGLAPKEPWQWAMMLAAPGSGLAGRAIAQLPTAARTLGAAAGFTLGLPGVSDKAEGASLKLPNKMGQLFDPAGRIAERAEAGFSKIKGGTPAEAMNWRLQHSDVPVETRTSMPVDKALRVGDEIIPIVGDSTRKLQQGYLTEVGGMPLGRPVLQEGGFDFALGQTVDPRGVQDVWGNAAGAATQIDKLAREALERGNRPVVMSTMMAKTGGDFSNQVFNTARQLTDPKLFGDELKAAIDTNMRKNMFSKNDAIKDWPGIGSENLDEFIKDKGGNVRAKLMKVLDASRVIKEGGPDIGMVRVANTNPDLYNTPSGYMGYHIANVTPGTGPAAHSTFPVATRGSEVRGLGGSVPGELVLRDLNAGLQRLHEITGSPQYLNRMDYYAIKPPREAAIAKGLQPLPKTQVVDQQMIDAIGEHVRKYGLKSVPPAMLAALYGRGQMGSTAAQDGYDAQ